MRPPEIPKGAARAANDRLLQESHRPGIPDIVNGQLIEVHTTFKSDRIEANLVRSGIRSCICQRTDFLSKKIVHFKSNLRGFLKRE